MKLVAKNASFKINCNLLNEQGKKNNNIFLSSTQVAHEHMMAIELFSMFVIVWNDTQNV